MRRTVQFWQVVDGTGQALRVTFPAKGLVQELRKAQKANVSRYYRARDDYLILAEGAAETPRPHVVVYRSRHVNLPGKDAGGTVVDLGLGANEGLAEGTHFVFFPNNIVGVLYNFEGPTTNRFSAYLCHKFGLDVTFVPVYRRDVNRMLAELEKVSKIEVSVPANQAHLFATDGDDDDPDGGFAQSLFHGARVLGEGNVKLVVSVGQGAPQDRYDKAKAFARRLARRPDLSTLKVAKVYGRNEGDEETLPIDLLTEQLITRKSVDPEAPTTTRISRNSAAAAIGQAYREYGDQITVATNTMPDLTRSMPIGGISPVEAPHENESQ